jgi:hypothetical protein
MESLITEWTFFFSLGFVCQLFIVSIPDNFVEQLLLFPEVFPVPFIPPARVIKIRHCIHLNFIG